MVFTVKKHAEIIQLERTGKTFIMRIANAGERYCRKWEERTVLICPMIVAGLFICNTTPMYWKKGRLERTHRENST